MDEAGETFLFGDDGESFIGTKDVLERPDLFYSAGAFLWPLLFSSHLKQQTRCCLRCPGSRSLRLCLLVSVQMGSC